MKNRILTIAVGVLMVCLLPMLSFAQQKEWQSTSAMQTSGSVYTPQVTAVGATAVEYQATTTESYSPSSSPTRGIHRSTKGDFDDSPTDNENYDSEHSPIGDAVLPLLLMACAYLAFRVARRRTLKQ